MGGEEKAPERKKYDAGKDPKEGHVVRVCCLKDKR